MNYELWFYVLLAFVVGRGLPRTIYIGPDKEKYKNADVGILL